MKRELKMKQRMHVCMLFFFSCLFKHANNLHFLSLSRDYYGDCDADDTYDEMSCNLGDCPPDCVINDIPYNENEVTRNCTCEIWWVYDEQNIVCFTAISCSWDILFYFLQSGLLLAVWKRYPKQLLYFNTFSFKCFFKHC